MNPPGDGGKRVGHILWHQATLQLQYKVTNRTGMSNALRGEMGARSRANPGFLNINNNALALQRHMRAVRIPQVCRVEG